MDPENFYNEPNQYDPEKDPRMDPNYDPSMDPRMTTNPYLRIRRKQNAFARTAVLSAIFAIFSATTVYPSIFFASLGILFAMLSRQDSMKMPKNARIACVICSIILIGMTILIVLVMRWLFVTFPMEVLTDPQALYNALLEYMVSMGIDPAAVTGGVL